MVLRERHEFFPALPLLGVVPFEEGLDGAGDPTEGLKPAGCAILVLQDLVAGFVDDANWSHSSSVKALHILSVQPWIESFHLFSGFHQQFLFTKTAILAYDQKYEKPVSPCFRV